MNENLMAQRIGIEQPDSTQLKNLVAELSLHVVISRRNGNGSIVTSFEGKDLSIELVRNIIGDLDSTLSRYRETKDNSKS